MGVYEKKTISTTTVEKFYIKILPSLKGPLISCTVLILTLRLYIRRES